MFKKVFSKLNYIFLHDYDETAPISDYLWFYGTVTFLTLITIVAAYKLIADFLI